MYIDELAKVAKEFAGLKPDTVIDDEERYYNREAVEKYEAVLAGGVYIHNHIMKEAREWFEKNYSVEEFVNDFCKTIE